MYQVDILESNLTRLGIGNIMLYDNNSAEEVKSELLKLLTSFCPNEKEIEVSLIIISASMERVVAEINKGIFLCSNCHRKYHAGVLDLPEDTQALLIEAPVVQLDRTQACEA